MLGDRFSNEPRDNISKRELGAKCLRQHISGTEARVFRVKLGGTPGGEGTIGGATAPDVIRVKLGGTPGGEGTIGGATAPDVTPKNSVNCSRGGTPREGEGPKREGPLGRAPKEIGSE